MEIIKSMLNYSYDRMRKEMLHAQNLVKVSSKIRKTTKDNGYLIEVDINSAMILETILYVLVVVMVTNMISCSSRAK